MDPAAKRPPGSHPCGHAHHHGGAAPRTSEAGLAGGADAQGTVAAGTQEAAAALRRILGTLPVQAQVSALHLSDRSLQHTSK